jgi:glucokinase
VRYAIGIDLGATNLRAGVIGEDGSLVFSLRRPTESRQGGERVLHNLIALGEAVLAESPVPREELVGVGIGSPGVVDNSTGAVRSATPNIPGWSHTPLAARVKERLGLPVVADNDVNVIACGEQRFGAARGFSDFVCLALGSGVGGAICLDGAIRRGAGFAAGEVGHLTVDANGRLCNCGRVGCVEAYASAWAIAERARARLAIGEASLIGESVGGDLDRIDAKVVFEAAAEGDALARVIVDEVIRMLAAALADLSNILDPALFVICGGIAQARGDLIPRLDREFRVAATVRVDPPPPVVAGRLGDDAGIVGGAALVFGGLS